MHRKYYDHNEMGMGSMNLFGAVLAGALVGAAALFFSDEKNRKNVAKAFENMREQSMDKVADLKEKGMEKADELKEKGLATVSSELNKAQQRVKKEQAKK